MIVTEKGHRTFGKCFEIKFGSDIKNELVHKVELYFLKTIYIYFNVANNFWNDNSRSKLQANVGEKLFLEITYEILKSNFGSNCKTYYMNNFDTCKETLAEEMVVAKYNCSVPYKSMSQYSMCSRFKKV